MSVFRKCWEANSRTNSKGRSAIQRVCVYSTKIQQIEAAITAMHPILYEFHCVEGGLE